MTKNLLPPPETEGFWELFDYFWDNGVGQNLSQKGDPTAWSAATLESALDHQIDIRSIENWRSRKFMPTRENIRKLCWVIAGGDNVLRKAWSDAFIAAWRAEKRKGYEGTSPTDQSNVVEKRFSNFASNWNWKILFLTVGAALAIIAIAWFVLGSAQKPSVKNIRICDAPYFDKINKDCTKHVSVFVHGIEEVFLSFDFENLPKGAPFERWWLRNGERVTGRTSYNDEAWPGYTYWRPEGGLPFGQYVVRIIVDEKVHTQTFQIQKEAFNIEN